MPDRPASDERCQELRDALEAAMAQVQTPARDTSNPPGGITFATTDVGDTTPDTRPGLERQIAELEQALREAGCD